MPILDAQGAYDTAFPAGYAGMVATAVPTTTLTGVAEDASLGFGLAVGQGLSDRGVLAGDSDYRGVTVADRSRDGDAYDEGEAVAYLTKGEIFVVAASNVSADDAVTYDAAGAVGAGLANTIPNARFKSSATAGALVAVHLG